MAVLVGIQLENGDWESFVLGRDPKDFRGSADVLGREIPCFRYLEAYDGIARHEAVRLAHSLRGIPKARRRHAFRDHAQGLRLIAKGGTLL